MKNKKSAGTGGYVRIALMAVLICVCSWIAVPFAVPFTMQTFAVFCSLILLGGRKGTAAIGLYIFMGLTGLPVFSGFSGGIGHLSGPTGGFIIGFLFIGIVYILLEPIMEKHIKLQWAVLGAGLAVCYIIGTAWFMIFNGSHGADFDFFSAFVLCVMPYVVPDCVKMALAVYICGRIRL